MRAPYGLHILENCLTCPVRKEHFFCNLPPEILLRFHEIRAPAVYPRRALLFMEGQQPRGIFVLCAGHAKLSASSFGGKTIITKVSESGEVLGLNAVVANRSYEVTAEMTEPGQASFIPRDSLLQFRQDHGEVALRVAEQLSRDYYTAYESVALSRSIPAIFAWLINPLVRNIPRAVLSNLLNATCRAVMTAEGAAGSIQSHNPSWESHIGLCMTMAGPRITRLPISRVRFRSFQQPSAVMSGQQFASTRQ